MVMRPFMLHRSYVSIMNLRRCHSHTDSVFQFLGGYPSVRPASRGDDLLLHRSSGAVACVELVYCDINRPSLFVLLEKTFVATSHDAYLSSQYCRKDVLYATGDISTRFKLRGDGVLGRHSDVWPTYLLYKYTFQLHR